MDIVCWILEKLRTFLWVSLKLRVRRVVVDYLLELGTNFILRDGRKHPKRSEMWNALKIIGLDSALSKRVVTIVGSYAYCSSFVILTV
jgi:hypothetical protein